MNSPTSYADDVRDSKALDWAIRAGLVAYGVVHLLIGGIAVNLALGDHGEEASSEGALKLLAEQPFGKFLVWATAIGLVMLVLWRLLEAWLGPDDEDGSEGGAKSWGKRASRLLKAVLYGALAYSAFKVATSDGGSGGGGKSGKGTEETITQRIMELPGGQVLVVLVGLAIIGYGGYLAYRGWTKKFLEHLDAEGRSGRSGDAYEKIGQVGHLAKGAAIVVIGGMFVYAGFTHQSRKSGGLDQALQEILQQPFGPVLLVAVGLGIACYGLFAFARARHLDR